MKSIQRNINKRELLNRIAILYFLLIFGCGGGFDPDTKGPVVNLVYPHEGYVVSDSVLFIYETEFLFAT